MSNALSKRSKNSPCSNHLDTANRGWRISIMPGLGEKTGVPVSTDVPWPGNIETHLAAPPS